MDLDVRPQASCRGHFRSMRLSKKEEKEKRQELKLINKLRQLQDVQRLLKEGNKANYSVGVKVVGKIDLPPNFMRGSATHRKTSKEIAAKTWNRPLVKLHNKQKGKCHYCGCKTTFWDGAAYEQQPNNSATVEHLYPRTDIRRGLLNGEYRVMACYGCNQGANEKIQQSIRSYDMAPRPWLIGILATNNPPVLLGLYT